MIKKALKEFSINSQNIFGWRTNKKILVIESDDWGSIRMPSKKAFDNLLTNGISVDKCPYNSNDSLETSEDLEALFETFSTIKDYKGNSLKLTANTIVANPDFEAIKKNKFTEYFYEDFVATYNRINGDSSAFDLIQQGISAGIYIPQLHGREHLHVNAWLKALQEGDQETLLAFDQGLWGFPTKRFNGTKMNFSTAFHIRNKMDENLAVQSITEAAFLFEKYFGFKSESFIAPRYIWNDCVERELNNIGVKFIQGLILQQVPYNENLKTKIHFFGSKNEYNQIYINRNVFFEPTQNIKFPWKKDALNRIDAAFRWGKPAIISMHRLNFMGGLNLLNRTNNLLELKELICSVKTKYPDVIFMSTNELGKLINNEK